MMYFSTRYTVESYAARSVAARSTSHVIHVLSVLKVPGIYFMGIFQRKLGK